MATTYTTNVVSDNSTLTNFKAWAQAISTALSTLGWTQTADTGQVNWSTIASVPSSTYVYEIWQAADSAASTTPIFLKMEYGFSTSSIGVRVTVGTGSNGSGTITGAVLSGAPVLITNNTTYSSLGTGTQFPCFFSGNAGEFRMLMWQGTGSSIFFAIERSKDSSGAVTTSYFTAMAVNASGNSASAWFQQSFMSSSLTNKERNLCSFVSSSTANTENFPAAGTTAAVPVWPLVGTVGNPMLGVAIAAGPDVGEGSTITLNIYAASHTYIATKQGSFGVIAIPQSNPGPGSALLMRYE